MKLTYASPSEISLAVAPLAAGAQRAGVFFDLDGTLAPIVDRPEAASVPERTRNLIERIGERYALVGVISGRRAAEARRILGLERLTYIGNHGYELARPGDAEATPAPALAGEERVAAAFAGALDPERLRESGLRIEDKGAIVALHWRGATEPATAERLAEAIAHEAEAAGLHTHRGRMVVELRPAVEIDKGVGLAALLSATPLEAAFYAGDDRTDADVFALLAGLVEAGTLQRAVTVAVVADETPPEVREAATLAVDGPAGLLPVLEGLA